MYESCRICKKGPGRYFYQETPPHVRLRGRTLKVIVKLANIVLLPEKPDYNGVAWHVEGMGNEAIMAKAILLFTRECDAIFAGVLRGGAPTGLG